MCEEEWQHRTVAEVIRDEDGLGMRFDDRCWCWIPVPDIAVNVGDRVSTVEGYPGGFHTRVVIGEREVTTYYGREMARRKALNARQ